MRTTDLEQNSDPHECRLCLLNEQPQDLIHPCHCIGSLRYTHRKCLDRWRTVSPHPDSLTTCEICKTQYRITYNLKNKNECLSKFRYMLAVTLDITFFIAIFVGLWIGLGYLGDMAGLNNLMINIRQKYGLYDLFRFTLESNIWTGRIWFWGFVCLFCILGIAGCIFYCCYREEGSSTSNTSSSSYYRRSDCYFICCGPTYYNGYYYGTPYGYWNSSDILCCWLCLSAHPHHFHHHNAAACDCSGCGSSCGNCGGDCKNCGGKEGLSILLVIGIVVVLILILCGIVFAVFMTFMIVNKIIKRHLHMLDRQQTVESEMVVDLDDPDQVSKAEDLKTDPRYLSINTTLPTLEKQPLVVQKKK